MEKIEKNNKLIADFLGYNKYIWRGHTMYIFEDDNHRAEVDLHYHSDWNWLMGVIEKIESLPAMKDNGNFFFEIHQDSVTVFNSTRMDIVIEVMGQGSRINNTYQAVIEFIKWYNNKPLVNPDEVKNNSSNKRDRVLKSIMERYGGLWNLKSAMREDEDVVLVNLCDDLNDEFSEFEVLDEIMAIFK